MYKIIKNLYKIRFQSDHFETCNIWAKSKGLSVVITFLSPMGCLPLPGAIHVNKKIRLQRDFFKLATNGQSDKEFLLTSQFCPKGLSVPALGLYTCIKSYYLNVFKTIIISKRLF